MKKKKSRIKGSLPDSEAISKKNFKKVRFFLTILGSFLLLNQYVSIEKLFSKVSIFTNWDTLFKFFSWVNANFQSLFSFSDRFIWYVILFSFVLLAFWELKRSLLSKFLNEVLKSGKNTMIFLVLLLAVSGRYYLASGDAMFYSDGHAHMAHIWLVFKSLQQGVIMPLWTNYTSSGNLTLFAYSPLYSYFAGFISFLVGNPFVGAKISFLIWHILSGIGLYLWISKLTGNKMAGLVAAMVSCFSNHYIATVLLGCRWHAALAITLSGFTLYFIEKIFKDGLNYRRLLSLSLLTAATFLACNNVGLWYIIFYFLYANGKLLFHFIHEKQIDLKKFIHINLPLGLGMVLLLPFGALMKLNYYDWMNIVQTAVERSKELLDSIFSLSFRPFARLFFWHTSNFGFLFYPQGYWVIGYMGLSSLILSILGFVHAWKTKKYRGVFIIYLFNLYAIFSFKYLYPVNKYIPFFYSMYVPRFTILLLTTLAGAAGIGYLYLAKNTKIARPLAGIIFLVLLLDVASSSFKKTYSSNYGWEARPVFDHLKNISQTHERNTGTLFPARAMISGINYEPVKKLWIHEATFMVFTGMPSISGANLAEYMASYKFAYKGIGEWFHREVQQANPFLDRDLLDALYLLNMKYIVIDKPFFDLSPGVKLTQYTKAAYLYEMDKTSPVIGALQLTSIPNASPFFHRKFASDRIPDDVQEKILQDAQTIVKSMGINKDRMTARTLFTVKSNSRLSGNDLDIKVLEYKIFFDRLKARIETSHDCFIRLAYSFYPPQRVYRNGEMITPLMSAGRTIIIPAKKGVNVIEVKPGLWPLE
ncbi:MAG: hypothetical protein JW827_03990, partial [Spirochaetes bacterium]|nr:hypothetical protein [Spirochaetota bacterium]